MDVTVSPNPLLPASSLMVTWSFDPFEIRPSSVTVNEFDSAGNQIASSGATLATDPGGVTFVNLKSDTTYFYQVCTDTFTDVGEDFSCSAPNAYSGHTAAASPPPPPPRPPGKATMQIMGIQAYPNHVALVGGRWTVVPNGATVQWVSSAPISQFDIEVDNPSGAFVTGLNGSGSDFPKSGGSTTIGPRPTGATYLAKIRGQISGTANWTDFSSPVQFTAPNNTNSLHRFLMASGITGSTGIRGFLGGGTAGLRSAMGV
jgi:hypothetical protein